MRLGEITHNVPPNVYCVNSSPEASSNCAQHPQQRKRVGLILGLLLTGSSLSARVGYLQVHNRL